MWLQLYICAVPPQPFSVKSYTILSSGSLYVDDDDDDDGNNNDNDNDNDDDDDDNNNDDALLKVQYSRSSVDYTNYSKQTKT